MTAAMQAKHTLGNCYAYTGDSKKAISLLLDAAEEASNEAVTPFCWRDAAAMYEQEGETAKESFIPDFESGIGINRQEE